MKMLLSGAVLCLAAGTIMPHAVVAKPGDRFDIQADALPAPGTTLPDDISPNFVPRPEGSLPEVPPGFSMSVFAAAPELTHVRWLKVAPNGDVFLSEQGPGKITVLRDADGDGRAEIIRTFAADFVLPHGMAFHNGAFYVADVRAIWRLPYRDGDLSVSGPPARVTRAPDLRMDGWHSTREIVFDSKGTLYLAMGARGDVLEDDPPPDASVQTIAPDGTMATFAHGLRNVVGLALYPGTDDLWGTVNERDELGANLPPDYMARIGKADFFGWPYAYAGPHPDPQFGARRPDLVARTKAPEVLFEAHSAPLGLVFYDGAQFPADFRGDAFVAFHGSGRYDRPGGYKVVRVKFEEGKPAGGYEDFVTGFATPITASADGEVLRPSVWGTPAGLAVAKDGSLLIADDNGTVIWRVRYTGK